MRCIRHLPMIIPAQGLNKASSVPSSDSEVGLSSTDWGVSWTTGDFIQAHNLIKKSDKYNFEGCKIPIPTKVRYDRLEKALGEFVTPKEVRTLQL